MKGQFIFVATIFLAATLLTVSITISNFETAQITSNQVGNTPNHISDEIENFNQNINKNEYNRNQSLAMIEMSSYVYSNEEFSNDCLELTISKHQSEYRFGC